MHLHKIETERILWSANRELSGSYCKEVVKILSDLAKAISDNNHQEKEKHKEKLLRRAIVKDLIQCGYVEIEYKRGLTSEELRNKWKPFRSSFREFETFRRRREGIDTSDVVDIREFLGKHQELVDFLFELQKKLGNLSHRFFWPLLNVYDVEIVYNVMNQQGGVEKSIGDSWSIRVLDLLVKENSVYILPGLSKQHAEQKMLEEKGRYSETGVSDFLESFGNENDLWTVITLKLCLFCELTFSSSRKVFQPEQEIAREFSSSGKIYENWESFCLEDKHLREEISKQWSTMIEGFLVGINDFDKKKEEEVWMEETTIEADFMNRR